MAVTVPTRSAADARAAAVLSSLHELTHPSSLEETWLDWVADHVARDNPPGAVVDLPVGAPWLRLVVIVPDVVA